MAMQTYRASVKAEFERLESEELADRVRHGVLTDEALSVAGEVLTSRGVAIPPVEDSHHEGNKAPPLTTRLHGFTRRCLSGRETLLNAYWIFGALILGFGVVLRGLDAVFDALGMGEFSGGAMALGLIFGVCIHSVAVWRCAKNARVYALGQIAKVYSALQFGLFGILIPASIVMQLLRGE